MWDTLVEQIDKRQIFSYMIPYQIDCDVDQDFCVNEHQLTHYPDIIAFKNGRVFDYYQKRFPHASEKMTLETFGSFITGVSSMNPLKPQVIIPTADISQCCLKDTD